MFKEVLKVSVGKVLFCEPSTYISPNLLDFILYIDERLEPIYLSFRLSDKETLHLLNIPDRVRNKYLDQQLPMNRDGKNVFIIQEAC
jgi:hypothetical protein